MASPTACWPGSTRSSACTPTWSARSPVPCSPARRSWSCRAPARWPSSSPMCPPSTTPTIPPERCSRSRSSPVPSCSPPGFLRLGSVLRFVSNAVMVGFINAVGVNIVLGQLENLTGYEASGANRVVRALDTLLHPGQLDAESVGIGLATIALIVTLERTRLGALGMVVAVVVTSMAAAGLGWDVLRLNDIAQVPNALPVPQPAVARARPCAPGAGYRARLRRSGAGRQHLGELPQPRRHLSGRLPRLHRPRRRQRGVRDVPGHGRRRLALRVVAPEGRRRTLTTSHGDRRDRHGRRHRRIRFAGGRRRHARPRRSADPDRCPHRSSPPTCSRSGGQARCRRSCWPRPSP